MSEATVPSGVSFRTAADFERTQSRDFHAIALTYREDVRERMLLLAEYYEARARLSDMMAEQFERIALRAAVAS